MISHVIIICTREEKKKWIAAAPTPNCVRRLKPCDNYIWYNIDRPLLRLYFIIGEHKMWKPNQLVLFFFFSFFPDNYEWCDVYEVCLWFGIQYYDRATLSAKWLWFYYNFISQNAFVHWSFSQVYFFSSLLNMNFTSVWNGCPKWQHISNLIEL